MCNESGEVVQCTCMGTQYDFRQLYCLHRAQVLCATVLAGTLTK